MSFEECCSLSHLQQKDTTGETIANLLGPTQIEINRYYIQSIGKVVTFLEVNELPLRGSLEKAHDDDEQDLSAGHFLKLFEYTPTPNLMK